MIEVIDKINDKFWRLNNLYWIINEHGARVKFVCNELQAKLYQDFWYMNVLLKARQFGGTTFIDIYFLDDCLFFNNIEAGIIAHNRDDAAKIFRRKVKYPYDNLPVGLSENRSLVTETKQELSFSNGSSIYVATSIRSGTVQRLHISEHGRICYKYPEKAEEIKTGSLNAIHPGGIVWIESTAMQPSGDFYEFCQIAQRNIGKELSKLDYKFHFFPWYWDVKNQLFDYYNIEFTEEDNKYFSELEVIGKTINGGALVLSVEQKAWYIKKKEIMGFLMKQEYPSTPEEAFEGSGLGLPFSKMHHVVSPMQVPDNAPIYMTFDWGYGKPFSVLWFWIDADGRFYLFNEWYGWNGEADTGLRMVDSEIAEGIIEREINMGINRNAIKVRLAGHDSWNKKPDYKGGGQGPSTSEVFAKHGLYLTKADSSRELKIRQFRERLRVPDNDFPMFQVYDICHQFIRTIPTLKADPLKPEDIDTNGEDHSYDSACQLCMFRPISLKDPKPLPTIAALRIDYLEKGTKENQYYEGMAREQESFDREYSRMMRDRFGPIEAQVADYKETVE